MSILHLETDNKTGGFVIIQIPLFEEPFRIKNSLKAE